MAGMLLMDVKGAFNHVSRNELMRKMEAMSADGDLVRWTGSFMEERKVSLVVDGLQCRAVAVETGGPARLPALAHTVRSLPERHLRNGGRGGGGVHGNVVRRRLRVGGGSRLRGAAMRAPGKSRNEGGRVGGQEPRRVRQCEGRDNSLH